MKITGFSAAYRKCLLSLAVILSLLAALLLGTPALAAPVLLLPNPDSQPDTPGLFNWQAVTSLSPPEQLY